MRELWLALARNERNPNIAGPAPVSDNYDGPEKEEAVKNVHRQSLGRRTGRWPPCPLRR